jgi:CheY-like chemotaxis protein
VVEPAPVIPLIALTPVVVVSGQSRAENEQRAREAGTAAYLEKPVKHEAVIKVVEDLIGKA